MADDAKPATDLELRMQYVQKLMGAIRPERTVFLVISAGSAVVMLVFAVVILLQHHGDVATLSGLGGSTGVLTVSTAQILRVWTDALKLVLPASPEGKS